MGDKAKIIAPDGYRIAIDGNHVVTFPMGAIVEGRVAEAALQDHAASRMFDQVAERKIVAPTETKTPRKRKAKR